MSGGSGGDGGRGGKRGLFAGVGLVMEAEGEEGVVCRSWADGTGRGGRGDCLQELGWWYRQRGKRELFAGVEPVVDAYPHGYSGSSHAATRT